MRTASPWWASLTLAGGLLLFLLGERFFSHLNGGRLVLTGVGLLLILLVTGARAWAMLGSNGARRRVERNLLVCHAFTLLALVLYLLSTDWGITKLGLKEPAAGHFHGALTVLYLVMLVASNLPLLIIELSLGTALRDTFEVHATTGDEAGVEYFRVRELGWSGFSLGLAIAFLMVTCQVSSERNVQTDVSYFKTSSPGDSTRKIVESASDQLKVLLFFPDVNEVKNQVKGYFDALSEKAPNGKVSVELHDRLVDAELAGRYKVTKDGTIVLVRGTGDKEKSQTLEVDPDFSKARTSTSKLRNFDREVNSALLKLMRDKRKAYLLVGHGELNDRDSMPAELKGQIPDRPITNFRRRLGDLNYEIKNLGLIDLAKDVPEDATVVIAFAPSVPLSPAEWSALSRYLDRGGRLMYITDPLSDTSLGALEQRFAIKAVPGHLSDERLFLPVHGKPSDHRVTATNQFSPHASTGSLSRTSADQGIRLNDAGALEETAFPPGLADPPRRTVTIRSMETSFMDTNGNFTKDGDEKQQKWIVGEAVEGPNIGKKDNWRALVFADADLFTDLYGRNQLGQVVGVISSGPLLDDSVKWLAGEEAVVGDVVSEDDKAIQHTKNEDVVWFTLMLIGAPIVVLAGGLFGTRRRRTAKKSEVTK
ncbi:MAG TPA: Gldg family protein [Kofleriaceae bacterium]|nr:Gldg family protein [Kofleriaceae bacterium]